MRIYIYNVQTNKNKNTRSIEILNANVQSKHL